MEPRRCWCHLRTLDLLKFALFSLLPTSLATERPGLTHSTVTLKHHADQTQSKLLSSLGKLASFKSLKTRQLWITNQLIIKNASQETIQMLLDSDEVSKVEPDRTILLLDPADNKLYGKTCNTTTNDGIPWGISRIEAPKAWAEGFWGQGIVVSNVDTGVQYTHEALKGNYRPEYGWFDPYDGTTIPNDPLGHGTQNMGTIVGRSKAIGVASEARWIVCKGGNINGFSTNALLECGQWTACPTDPDGQNPNCTMAPLVSANSWGGYDLDGFYDDILEAYDATGIHAVFAIGNGGPECGSTAYPGESRKVIGVGATTTEDTITDKSGVGPPSYDNDTIKPDVAAPGRRVCSSSSFSDDGYVERDGTSVACPHVAGLVALLLSRDKGLSTSKRQCIRDRAVPVTSTGKSCGGLPDDKFPNFRAGYGRVTAAGALKCTCT